jgi:hypothetical protein
MGISWTLRIAEVCMATSRRDRGYGVIAQRRKFSALLKMLRAALA